MNSWKAWLGILGVPLIAAVIWYVWSGPATPAPAVEDFSKIGNLVKDNPGLERGVWHLIYEEPGAPGLSMPLLFDGESECTIDGIYTVCDMSFEQGERAQVEGVLTEGRVHVAKLTHISPAIPEDGTAIKLYFYNPAYDQGPGGVQCTEAGLVAVERVIPKTITPLTESIKLLLRGEISDEERAQGIESEFPLEGVELEKAVIVDGVATLTFSDPQRKTVGGSCRVSILWNQIEATAKQFPTVQFVSFLPEELFQP